METHLFGTGYLFLAPIGGNQATNPSPVHLGTLQDVTVDLDQKLVELYGSSAAPDDVAPGKLALTGKATIASFDAALFAATLGFSAATGSVQTQTEQSSVPAVTPYTITVTNSATFKTNLGVIYASTGATLTEVTGTPTQGQYSVAAGVYTFAAADEGVSVLISYASTLTTGSTVTVVRQFQGYGPSFELYLENPYPSGQSNTGLHIFSAKSGKLSFPFKQDEFLKSEMDFTAFYNSAGQLMEWYNP